MGRYRKVPSSFWNDEVVASLSGQGQRILLHLMTSPQMTSLGALRGNAPGLACELGIKVKEYERELSRLCELGLVKVGRNIIWLPGFLEYNKPESPNVIRSWKGSVEDLPDCEILSEAIEAAGKMAISLGEAFAEAFAQNFHGGTPLPTPPPTSAVLPPAGNR